MDKKVLLVQLKSMLNQECYSKWNETSLKFMELIISDDENVEELRNVAKKLLEGYHIWKK